MLALLLAIIILLFTWRLILSVLLFALIFIGYLPLKLFCLLFGHDIDAWKKEIKKDGSLYVNN